MSTINLSRSILRNQERAARRSVIRIPFLPRRWGVHLALILCCFIFALPILYAMLVSTQTNEQLLTAKFSIGTGLMANISETFQKIDLPHYMLNSAFVALAVTFGKTILSLLAGLAFVYFRFRGKQVLFSLILVTIMMPTEILVVGLLRLMIDLHWGSTFPALIVPFLASATGVFLFRQHFSNIPVELAEATQIDGGTPLQFLRYVLIPMSWNMIGALLVTQFIIAWNVYLWPQLAMQTPDNQVVTVALQRLLPTNGQGIGTNYGVMMIAALIASLPPVLVFLLLQRQFLRGFAFVQEK
jgi:sn-glycerol 3-phosphate transport system permease protein